VRSVNGSNLSLVEAAPVVHFHEFALLFPELPVGEYQELRESIRQNGLLEPIVLNAAGEVLDGRHRLRVCLELGITPWTIQFSEMSLSNTVTEIQYIFGKNAIRRHLTAQQRAVLSLKFLPALRAEARARREAGRVRGLQTQASERTNGNGHHAFGPAPESNRTKNQVVAILAKRAGTGVPVVRAAILANDHAPELLPKLSNGCLTASEVIERVATKRNRATPLASLDQKTVLKCWAKTWKAFLGKYPSNRRKEVRQIVMAHLSGLAF
jgi:hypothetical protein